MALKLVNIVMLPTKDGTNIFEHDKLTYHIFSGLKFLDVEYQHLYIITDDVPKEGDWCYYPKYVDPIRLFDQSITNTPFKVVATTARLIIGTTEDTHPTQDNGSNIYLPQIPERLSEKYCKAGGFDEVIIEFDNRCCGRCDGVNDLCYTDLTCVTHKHQGCEICFGESGDVIKIYKNNLIAFQLLKEKVYSSDEVQKLFEKLTYEMAQKIIGNRKEEYPYEHDIIPQDWIKDNL